MGYKILHEFPDYNCPVEVRASVNNFLHMPSSLHNETLEETGEFVHGTLQKERQRLLQRGSGFIQ